MFDSLVPGINGNLGCIDVVEEIVFDILCTAVFFYCLNKWSPAFNIMWQHKQSFLNIIKLLCCLIVDNAEDSYRGQKAVLKYDSFYPVFLCIYLIAKAHIVFSYCRICLFHWVSNNLISSILLQPPGDADMKFSSFVVGTSFSYYKVLTTSKPNYLNNLISVQPPHSIRSSSVVTLSRPPTISSLKITDRSFRYASPRLWNQLPDSFRHPLQSCLNSPPHSLISSSLSSTR